MRRRVFLSILAVAIWLLPLASVAQAAGDGGNCKRVKTAAVRKALKAGKPNKAERLVDRMGIELVRSSPEETPCLAATLAELAALRAVAYEEMEDAGKSTWLWHGAAAMAPEGEPVVDLQELGEGGVALARRLADPPPPAPEGLPVSELSHEDFELPGAKLGDDFMPILMLRQFHGSVEIEALQADDGSVLDMTISATGSPLLVYGALTSAMDFPREGRLVQLTMNW